MEDLEGPVTSREQDAIRILLLLDGACGALNSAETADPELAGAVGVVRGQVQLQKLDFWLRNPDYLADELLNDYETSRESALLDYAGEILDSEEPEVRRYPMLRNRFGAYQWLEDAVAVLRSAGMAVRRKRGTINSIRQHDYFLLEEGRKVAREIVCEEPVFSYYVDRVQLVLALADGLGGTRLKERQYLQREYAETAWGSPIGSVSVRARERLARLRKSGG